MAQSFDYVIAGGGAAGCVLAARLSAGNAKVLLIEAGPPDNHPFIHMPAGFTKLSGPRVNWGYRTVPQKHLNNRDMWYPQGRTLGGGSSINAMIYTRGHKTDYDRWAAAGATGWGYEDLLPYFRKAESNSRFSNRYHGADGPLAVSDPISPLKITAAFIKAAQEAGAPYNPDFNGAGRRRLSSDDDAKWTARQRGSLILAPCPEQEESDRHHQGAGAPRRRGTGARGRGRVSARWLVRS